PVHDFSRRVSRCANSIDTVGLVAWHKLAHRWNIWQRLGPRSGRHPEPTQLAASDVLDRRWQRIEVDLYLPSNQICQRWPGAAIRHMNHVDPGEHLEHFAGHMSRSADPR